MLFDSNNVGKYWLQQLKPEKLHVEDGLKKHSIFNPMMSLEKFEELHIMYKAYHFHKKPITNDDMIKIVKIVADYRQMSWMYMTNG